MYHYEVKVSGTITKGEKMSEKHWYKNERKDQIWWLDNGNEVIGEHIFSFDKKTEYNLFADYPWKLTEEQVALFDKENPFWAEFFADRKKEQMSKNDRD